MYDIVTHDGREWLSFSGKIALDGVAVQDFNTGNVAGIPVPRMVPASSSLHRVATTSNS